MEPPRNFDDPKLGWQVGNIFQVNLEYKFGSGWKFIAGPPIVRLAPKIYQKILRWLYLSKSKGRLSLRGQSVKYENVANQSGFHKSQIIWKEGVVLRKCDHCAKEAL